MASSSSQNWCELRYQELVEEREDEQQGIQTRSMARKNKEEK